MDQDVVDVALFGPLETVDPAASGGGLEAGRGTVFEQGLAGPLVVDAAGVGEWRDVERVGGQGQADGSQKGGEEDCLTPGHGSELRSYRARKGSALGGGWVRQSLAMRLAVLAWAGTVVVYGASLGGVVVENASGRTLAGVSLTLRRIEGIGVSSRTLRAGRNGAFEFPPLGEGQYLLMAERRGFLPWRYGQKTWNGAARPFTLGKEERLFLQVKMLRMPAIAGTVLDENDVGIPELEVLAQKLTEPPVTVKRTKTDDRGQYRLGELEPGRYVVRSGAEELEPGFSILPTLSKETTRLEEAIPVDVGAEETAAEVNVRPIAGRLARLDVAVGAPRNSGPWQIRLVSEALVRSSGGESATFDRLPPGRYEIYVDGKLAGQPACGFQTVDVYQDRQVTVQAGFWTELIVRVMPDAGQAKLPPFQIRRRTLAGKEVPMPLEAGSNRVPAGNWEITLPPNPVGYLISPDRPPLEHGTVHVHLTLIDRLVHRLQVSTNASVLSGKVVASMGQAVVGAPVYLEMVDAVSKQRTGELLSTVTGTRGEYRFEGLRPTSYRLLSTFDMVDPEPKFFEMADRKVSEVRLSGAATVDLELYEVP